MENLFIEGTVSSPIIDFNAETGLLKIIGQSYPENAFKFYEPVFKWLDEYFELVTANAIIDFNVVYINTSSTKCIMDIMFKAEEAADNSKKVVINWRYNNKNRNILECGQEFKEDMEIEFNLLEIE